MQNINEVRTEQQIANDANNNGRDYRAMTGRKSRRSDQDQELMDCLHAENEEWQIAIRERNTAENSVQVRRLEFEAKREGKLISDGYFRSYVLEILKPAIEYFIAKMIVPLEDSCKYCRAARCFDPFFVK